MEGTCPVCRSGLLHSLAAVAPSDANLGQISPNSQNFIESLPETISEASVYAQQDGSFAISQVESSLDKTCGLQEVNDTSSSLSMCINAQKPCAILPRYLADSLKQVNVRPCEFTASSGGSGISSTSTSSSLSYHEALALRVQQRAASTDCESPRAPSCTSLLEKYTQQNYL